MKNRTGILKGGTDTSGVEQQQVFRRDPRSFQWRDMSGETRKRKIKRSGREGKKEITDSFGAGKPINHHKHKH